MSATTQPTVQYGTAPESLGVYNLDGWHEFMHYMYLPIYIHDVSLNVEIPERLEFARDLIRAAMWEELHRGNVWTHIYVTARRGYATPGNPLNRPGWHSDGFGTEDINYVWTDRYPTLFAVQDFGDIDDDHIISGAQFEYRIAPESILTYPDRTLQRLDHRVVHAAPEIAAPGGVRSFFKVSFSNSRYNLLGNSHNYLLDYDWPLHDRQAVRNDPAHAEADSVRGVS